jgi:hypothetical protein
MHFAYRRGVGPIRYEIREWTSEGEAEWLEFPFPVFETNVAEDDIYWIDQ